tara:strand:+ start:59 stop:2326 length:2268 start_codon:yes stop_codon:yes gene_type:complete
MLRRVKITSVPKARTGYQVKGSLANDVPAMGGADYNAYIGQQKPEVRKNLTAVPREEANLEAEGGETVIGNIDGSSMPSFYGIKGPRHHSGGVPLSLPDDSFIFSDTQSMKIGDPTILKMFNKPVKKGGYTPAELSKQYDVNKYRQILQDPDTDKIARKTAELMIKNYVMKLGALALAQEAKKGFPQGIPMIAQPYMEANQIAPEQVMPELAQQAPEQGMPQEGMMPEPQMEQGMEQGMPEEQMEMAPEMMEQAPMAAYGMEMGGYNIPFAEYAYGGYLPKAPDGLIIKPYEKANLAAGNVTPMGTDNKFSSKGQPLPEYLKSWESNIPGISKMSEGEAQKAMYEWSLKNNPDAISSMWGTHGLTAQGLKLRDQKALSTDGSGKFTAEQLKDPALLAKLQASYVDNKFGVRQLDPNKPPAIIPPPIIPPAIIPPVGTPCPCVDQNGKAMLKADGTPEVAQKDKDGKCLPCTTKKTTCECEDGTDPGKNEDGTCKDCAGSEGITPKKPEAEWWLQDTVNTMGAFGDTMSLKKYMPWEARVDLEEPRPTFLDPTRELAQQSEQANIASQAAAQFAGPQALNARLAGIQGQGARSAADTLSRVNNQNVGIANQFEANQVGVRNQESMANQQMANRVYDKNVISNQQFDNSKAQGRSNQRQAYNTAVTNKWKTDALNQMYPNYQTSAGPGGRVEYTPTDKKVDPGKEQDDMFKYRNELHAAGWTPEEIKAQMDRKYGKAKKHGGEQHNGYIYTDWPIFR